MSNKPKININNKQKLIITISIVATLTLGAAGVGIAYLVLSQDITIPEYITNALKIAWNSIIAINLSFTPIKLINVLISTYKNRNYFKDRRLAKKEKAEWLINFEEELKAIINSSLPDHVKKAEIAKLIESEKVND